MRVTSREEKDFAFPENIVATDHKSAPNGMTSRVRCCGNLSAVMAKIGDAATKNAMKTEPRSPDCESDRDNSCAMSGSTADNTYRSM
mmetsp:Transcript_584/g.1133  ORF Transcript_584/g.1133 Transcript_584/m.1133 type:complete len:87 (+) Transcript_584:1120-1380(+)